MNEKENDYIRYNALIHKDSFKELKTLAEEDRKKVIDMIRSFLDLGIKIKKAEKNGGYIKICLGEGKPEERAILI